MTYIVCENGKVPPPYIKRRSLDPKALVTYPEAGLLIMLF
jgi:hypothetical protein